MTQRETKFEYLRILSIAMIIAFHYVFKAGFSFPEEVSGNKLLVDILWHFGELAVNVFLLISGYFYERTVFHWKKVCFMIAAMYFYIVLGLAVLKLTGQPLPDSFGRLDLLLPLLYGKYWIIAVYLLVYLLVPYLQKLVDIMTKAEFQRLLLTQTILWSVIPTFVLEPLGTNMELMPYFNRFIWLTLVWLYGAYIRKYGMKLLRSLRSSMLLLVSGWAVTVGYILLKECVLRGNHPGHLTALWFWPPNSILELLLSLALFGVFLHINAGYARPVHYAASCTLGIYMLHDGVLVRFFWSYLFQNASHQDSAFLPAHIAGAVVSVMLLGILTETVRRFLERPLSMLWDSLSGQMENRRGATENGL